MKNFSDTWTLDSLLAEDSQPATLQAQMNQIKQQLEECKKKLDTPENGKMAILQYQELDGHCRDLEYYFECMLAQNTSDQQALQLYAESKTLRAACDSLNDEICQFLAQLDEPAMRAFCKSPKLEAISFHLYEKRDLVREKLPITQERLINQLSIDGFHGWNDIYETFMGQLRIFSPLDAKASFSVGQVTNFLLDPVRSIRQDWFAKWEETWLAYENLAAQMINHLAGYKLSLCQARKHSSILQDPLQYNRMQESTLWAMWNTIDCHKEMLIKYLQQKAKNLKIDRLAWYDIEAPLPSALSPKISYQEAAETIIEDFSTFSDSMGTFARQAFEEKWIEAEDRAGKRPGGFCVPFLHAKETRIFMTYGGTMNNLLTLAHELGHAYHSYEVRDLPIFSQQYPMNVAETASTLAEMLVLDSWMNRSSDPTIQLSILDNKLQRAVMFLMNIHARFLFELEFYQAREKGFVIANHLNSLMENAQKKAFCNALSEWHPHFWVAKQHFFITEVSFYNFPYTFGYLFSQGIYARLKHDPQRERVYANLLQDTGRMPVEDLAQRHLDVKLEEPGFWEDALKLVEKDVAQYISLSQDV